MTDDIIKRGRKLLEAASDRPWEAIREFCALHYNAVKSGGRFVVDYTAFGEDDGQEGADASLIAFAVNNLAALLDVAEAAQECMDMRSEDGCSLHQIVPKTSPWITWTDRWRTLRAQLDRLHGKDGA